MNDITGKLPQVVAIMDLQREGGLTFRISVRESPGVPPEGVVR